MSAEQDAALDLVAKSYAIRDSAEAAYDESLRLAVRVGCSNVAIGEAVGQGESSIRRYLVRRGLRNPELPAVTSSEIPVEDLRIGPPPTQVNIEGQGLVDVQRVTEELIERRRGRGRGLL